MGMGKGKGKGKGKGMGLGRGEWKAIPRRAPGPGPMVRRFENRIQIQANRFSNILGVGGP